MIPELEVPKRTFHQSKHRSAHRSAVGSSPATGEATIEDTVVNVQSIHTVVRVHSTAQTN